MFHTWRDYWSIYSNGIGGWFAWHAQNAKRINLVAVGTYIEAENELQRLRREGNI